MATNLEEILLKSCATEKKTRRKKKHFVSRDPNPDFQSYSMSKALKFKRNLLLLLLRMGNENIEKI